MKENNIIRLTDREHTLARPGMYVGGMTHEMREDFILSPKGVLEKRTLSVVPALLKIVNEILDNSVDEAIRTGFAHANEISLDITSESVKVMDNGRGIPVKEVEGHPGEPPMNLMPVVAWCEAKAGSNFSDEDRQTLGTHGIGSFATNCLSTRFEARTWDGKKELTLRCAKNMETIEASVKASTKRGTVVAFVPDFPRFGVKGFDQDHIDSLYNRLVFLSLTYPDIKFSFNGKRLKTGSFKDFAQIFDSRSLVLTTDKFLIAVAPNDEDDFQFLSYVNGLHVKNGGNHVDLITTKIVAGLRDKYARKYKDLKPGDIRNKLKLLVLFNGFPSMKFNSQTKEALTNSQADVATYLDLSAEDWDKFVMKLYKSELTETILDTFRMKEELKHRKELSATKTKKRIASEKFVPSIGDQKYLVICEGDSALGGLMSALGRNGYAYFPLKGKPLNTYDAKIQKIAQTPEIRDLAEALGLDLSKDDSDMDFEKVLIATDADLDGTHIRGLLIAFFHRFAPSLLKSGRICILQTPMVVGYDKTGKPAEWYLTFEEYLAAKDKPLRFQYYKGLGTWTAQDFRTVVEKNLNQFVVPFKMGNPRDLAIWMGSDRADDRKKALRGKAFDIFRL